MVVKTYFTLVSLPASKRKNPLKMRWIGNYSTARSKESKQAEINWQLFRIHASGIRHAVSRFLYSEKIWTLRWTGGRHKKKRERKKYTGQTWIENTGKSALIDCLHCCSLCSVKSVQVWRVSERFLQTIWAIEIMLDFFFLLMFLVIFVSAITGTFQAIQVGMLLVIFQGYMDGKW